MKLFGLSLSAVLVLCGSAFGAREEEEEELNVRKFNTPFISCGDDPSGKGSCLVLDRNIYQSLLEMPVDTLIEFNQFQTERNTRSILRLKRFSASDNGDDLDKVVLLRGAAFEDDSYLSSNDYFSSFQMKPSRTAFIALSPYGSNGLIEILNSTFVLSTPWEGITEEKELDKEIILENEYIVSLREKAQRFLPHIKNTLRDFNMNHVSVIFNSAILNKPAQRPITDYILPPSQEFDDSVIVEREDLTSYDSTKELIKTFKIAADVDYELFKKKGSSAATSTYYYTLIGHSGSIYRRDFGSDFTSSYVKIYDKPDPYPTTNGGDCLNYMKNNWSTTTPARSFAALISGKGLGGGVAYFRTLCNKASAYSVSGGISGSYPTPVRSFDKGNWDIFVFMHEVGHTWGAAHTHALSPPVDTCNVTPCPATKGTIMSYCHLCSGGMTNIDLAFHQRTKDQVKAFVATLTC